MAFPVVAARITGRTTNTNTTTHAITLPAGVVAGNLLVVVFSTDGAPTVTAQQAGWTKLGQASNTTVVTGAIFYKVATGSDALTLTTSAAEASSHVSVRITGADTAITATSANGSSTNSNPPAHTPPGRAKDYLWMATRSGDVAVLATAAPASFANLQSIAAAGTNGASTNTAEQALNVAALDPGTFTSATEQWVSWTIAVPPALPPAQSRSPEPVASTAMVSAPQVIAPQVVVPAVVASTAVVAAPTVATRYPVTVASTASVPTPAPAKSTIVPALAASTASVATPAPLRLTVIAVLVASTASVIAPVVIGEQILTPALLANTAAVSAPTVATRYPLAITSTASVSAPTVATHYPVAISSTATVAAPTVVIRVAPVTVVNRPAVRTTSPSLAPSTSLLPSAGGDRFFPPTTTVNLWQTTLPELVASTATVAQPTMQPGGIVAAPVAVASTSSVGAIAAVDTVTQYRYPRALTRAVNPSPSLAPSPSLVPATVELSRVYLPTAWLGSPQTVSVATIGSTAVVAPVAVAARVFPRAVARTVAPSPGLTPSPGLVPATAGLSTVHPPTAHAAVTLAFVPGPSGSALYPSESLYPGEDLYPSDGTGAPTPTVLPGPVGLAPVPVPSGSTVNAPTLSGSGVNFVPLLHPVPVASAAMVLEPTAFVAPTGAEMEFLDTEESVEAPNIILQGELLLVTEHVGAADVVALPTVATGGTQVQLALLSSTATVLPPRVITLQARVPQIVASSVVVGLPRVLGATPPRDPYTSGTSANVPVVSSGLSAGVPALVAAGIGAGTPVPV